MACFPISKIIVATCNLNQWALDFDQNLNRIITSIQEAKEKGARYRVGPELEISGYSCEDHFLEIDTFLHSEQSLAKILESDLTNDILCDIGIPLIHNNVRYNCRVLCLNKKIVLIRPKIYLADDGNYRERRWFTGWKDSNGLDTHYLSETLRNATNQVSVPIGYGIIQTKETKLAVEICEELWTPNSPNIDLFLAGVEIISNSSGSHHQLRKLQSRLSLIQSATSKSGGVYLYSNHRGCDGTRLYFDGSSLISLNGTILNIASQFSLLEVEVVTAVIDLNDIRSYRQGAASFQEQSSAARIIPIVDLTNFSLCVDPNCFNNLTLPCTLPIEKLELQSPEQECALGPACWLWDYLRRSGASGFLLPLSGGADSSSVATIVFSMCSLAVEAAKANNSNGRLVRIEINRLMQKPVLDVADVSDKVGNDIPTAQELCGALLNTVYMGTSNSSRATHSRASNLSKAIGSHHSSIQFDSLISALLSVFSNDVTNGRVPKFISQGGTHAEDLALQNIQARLRMVIAYLCAQLFPWVRNRKGFLLVLGSANVDESLRGYMTKYDCSSADINPIGGICKADLARMMGWASGEYKLPILTEILNAVPTAELRPIAEGETKDYTQTDEEDMGMSYAELRVFGLLRKVYRCGPVTMFMKLLSQWSHLTPAIVAEKVKRFFFFYSVNRHKLTTLTPSYHAENYGTDDNRFDLRQFLYNVMWPRQFHDIDELVKKANEKK